MNRQLTFLSLFFFSSFVYAGESSNREYFEKQLFAPQTLNYFGIANDRFQPLTIMQKHDLLEARKSLLLFLKTTQIPDADLSRFLGGGLHADYKNRNEFLDKLIGQEAEILITAVTEFEFHQNGTINLKYYVVLFSEGNLLLREDMANLRKQELHWKIMSIGGLKN